MLALFPQELGSFWKYNTHTLPFLHYRLDLSHMSFLSQLLLLGRDYTSCTWSGEVGDLNAGVGWAFLCGKKGAVS